MIRRIPWGIRKPPLGVRHNPSHPLSIGLVGHWIMNEGGGLTAYDISGKGNHGTLTSGPTWTAGQFGPAISFDGSNDFVSVGSPAALNLVGEASIFCWARFADLVTTQELLAQAAANDVIGQIALEVGRTDAKLSVLWADTVIGTSTGTVASNIWYHLGFTRAGTTGSWTWRIYINGAQDSTNTSATNPGSQQPFSIGKDGAGALPFNGLIDDVRIFNRALSADEVRYLYIYPFADLQSRRQILVEPSVAAAAGRIFKLAGRGGGLAGPSIGLAG